MIQKIKYLPWVLAIKWAYQRVVRGYDDTLMWSLAEYIDPLIRAHIENLRDNAVGHPAGLTEKKWKKVLDTILLGFGDEPEFSDRKAWNKYWKNREKALVLLAFYWDGLWD